jgi:probable F420-dependent oxidoreductase
VRPHIERRFGEPWSAPVARLAEYVDVLRAIWSCWNDGVPLDFEGRFFRHTLMTPMFDPGPSGQPPPAVHLAAVGPAMVEMAAQRADGLVLHPLSSVRTISENVLPIVRRHREAGEFELSCPVLVVTGDTDEERDRARTAVRKQLAFYASTPAYRWILETYDESDRADALRQLSRKGRWDDMTALIPDELLGDFAVEAPPSALAGHLHERFSGTLDRVALYMPYEVSPETWRKVAAAR